jgi:lysophospholipase L1-like esterase
MRLSLLTLGSLLAFPAIRADEPLGLHTTIAMLKAGEAVKIVCVGDSITGVYYHTGGRRAYPDMVQIALERAYPKARVTAINAGISGDTTRGGLMRLERDVLAHKPHLVTIMFGMNDMTRLPLEEFKANMTQIIQRCRKARAEVLLCTQNDVFETGGRPRKKLAEVASLIHRLGRELKVPVADCHQAFTNARAKDAMAFALLMSDDIHPNMDGHKLLAETIAGAISGKPVSLANVGPPQPALPKTLSLLKSGKAIKVLAMPPYDQLIGPALKKVKPEAKVEVTAWQTAGQTLAQIEQAAKKVRTMKMDLVVIAVPAAAQADPIENGIRSYSWIINWSLSFGKQEWDCIAQPPSTAEPKLSVKDQERDRLARRLISAQDLSMVERKAGDQRPAAELLEDWLRGQAKHQ